MSDDASGGGGARLCDMLALQNGCGFATGACCTWLAHCQLGLGVPNGALIADDVVPMDVSGTALCESC